jgi:transposase
MGKGHWGSIALASARGVLPLVVGVAQTGVVRCGLDDSWMAQNFIGCDRDQELLLPPSLREWLPEDHLAWFVLEAVGELDLAAFYGAYREDGWGRAAHDPSMMVALLVYAYSLGVRSARGIERRCRADVAFRVICANQTPDHTTIARFRARHEDAISGLFGGVLALCARAGLVHVGMVAVDGTKVAAAATHHATRSYEQIAQEIVEEAGRVDAAEDELYGDARGDELPEGLRTVGDRRKVLREAKQALEAERAAKAKPIPRDRAERLAECKQRLEQDRALERKVITEHAAWHARGIASDGSRRMAGARANIKPYPLTDQPAGKLNATDPDSRNLKTTRGWVQGYNAQATVTEQQIVVAAEISIESLDTANLEPMVETARAELQAAGIEEQPGVVLADAGYWKNEAIEALVTQGIQTLVAPDADRRKEPRPGRRGGLYDFTRRVLATDFGKELYLKRQATVEPVFGRIKANRGANRFLRRGRAAVRSEWRLLTHTLRSSTNTSSPPPEPRAGDKTLKASGTRRLDTAPPRWPTLCAAPHPRAFLPFCRQLRSPLGSGCGTLCGGSGGLSTYGRLTGPALDGVLSWMLSISTSSRSRARCSTSSSAAPASPNESAR